MRRVLRDNGLSVALFALFLLSFGLHALGRDAELNQQRLEHGAAPHAHRPAAADAGLWHVADLRIRCERCRA